MARLTFSGGIHPYDGKDMSKSKPIKDVDPRVSLSIRYPSISGRLPSLLLPKETMCLPVS